MSDSNTPNDRLAAIHAHPLIPFPVANAAEGEQPPIGEGDERFTFDLVHDVARVIESHGYRAFRGGDYVELQLHLYYLLHSYCVSCPGGPI